MTNKLLRVVEKYERNMHQLEYGFKRNMIYSNKHQLEQGFKMNMVTAGYTQIGGVGNSFMLDSGD